ncbi:MAG: iron hydrogenase small subunit [Sutterella wadsworthensis]
MSDLCVGAAVVTAGHRRHGCPPQLDHSARRRPFWDDKLCQAMGRCFPPERGGMSVYKDMKAKPVDHTMHELLHTHYYSRSMLAMTEAAHV